MQLIERLKPWLLDVASIPWRDAAITLRERFREDRLGLTASSLTIKGHGVSLSGGATMTVAGDLFRIANGSSLTLTNGALLSLSGGSPLNITGALINFIGTGNTLSITNTLCGNGGCSMIGNLPVFVSGGGTISLSNPVVNLTGNNTLTVAPGAAVISVTGGAQVKQGQ